ncbi:MAG: radical SAM protein [Clostridiales bacterium]|nr:radical SAM protein [Clostridiales bacterium]
MDCKKLAEIKAGLLCYGVNVDKAAGEELLRARPYFYDKGFVHAVNANIAGSNVCVSVAEGFSGKSPYHLRGNNGKFTIEIESGESVPISLFDDLPKTDTVIDDLARPHSNHVISLWPSLVCCYDRPGMKCKFCSIKPTEEQTVVPAEDVIDGLKALFAKTDKYAINIGGGTHLHPDNMADYLTKIIRGVRTFTSTPISVEMAPPTDVKRLKTLHDAGASSLIMNLEVANIELRKAICPGKSSISYEHYYECYRYAVEVFGRGKVSCVLIAGIQPNEDIVTECEKLTDIGVIPTIIPFKAMDDCEYHNRPNCNADDLLWISTRVGAILREKGLSPKMQEGCTKCGGCSLETNYFDMI